MGLTDVRKPRKWYNSYQFPLIPQFEKREGDSNNTNSYSFQWLGLRIWTLDNFAIEIEAGFNCHWGIFLGLILPYLRIVLNIPLLRKIDHWFYKNLRRKPKGELKWEN